VTSLGRWPEGFGDSRKHKRGVEDLIKRSVRNSGITTDLPSKRFANAREWPETYIVWEEAGKVPHFVDESLPSFSNKK